MSAVMKTGHLIHGLTAAGQVTAAQDAADVMLATDHRE